MRKALLPVLLMVIAASALAEPHPLDRFTVGASAGLRSREQPYSSLWLDTGPILASSGLTLTYAAYNSLLLLPVTYATVDLTAWYRPLSSFSVPEVVRRIAVRSGIRTSLQTSTPAEGRLHGLALGWWIELGYRAVFLQFMVPQLRGTAILYGDGLWIEGETGLGCLLWNRLLVSTALELVVSASYFGLGTASSACLTVAMELLL